MTRILSVTEFLEGVNTVLAGVPAIVEGELSQFSVRQEKWCFFSLKDEASVVECFMPAWKLQHIIEDGMLVRVAGVPRVYEKNGRFRITVERLEPVGEGSLRRACELLRAKLEREGLFAPERKRTIPRFPGCIGLIASVDSAAYSDFLRIIRNRWGAMSILVQDVRVQGDGAVQDIVTALRVWSDGGRRMHGERPDVLVLTRGGGSLEDLQGFNSEDVARAIFASLIPVVVGVGHERDVTIADLVADVRASTPSNAAERVVPDRNEVQREVSVHVRAMGERLTRVLMEQHHALERFILRGRSFVMERRRSLDGVIHRIAHRQSAWCASASQRVQHRLERVVFRTGSLTATYVQRLQHLERLLVSLHPQRMLERGYSMSFIRGRLLRQAREVRLGDVMVTRLADGTVRSIAEGGDA